MLEFASMSPEEVQFIRLYVAALRREYYLLKSVIDIMHPDSLGVKNFAEATRVAIGLAELQQDFDAKIRQLQRRKKMRERPAHPGPTLDQLADIFSLSFFKLITTVDTPKTGKLIDSNGWFSGKPTEWKKTLQNYKHVPKNKQQALPDLLTDFFAAALKFFPFDNKTWLSNQSHITKKVWPPDSKNWHDTDYEIDDDAPDEGGPFDWLFDDNDDD